MESDTIASHHAGFLPPVSLMGPAGTRDLWERREGAAWGVAGGHAVTVQASQKVSASMPDSVMVPPQSFKSTPPAMPAKEPEPGPGELQRGAPPALTPKELSLATVKSQGELMPSVLAPEALPPGTVRSAADPMQPTHHHEAGRKQPMPYATAMSPQHVAPRGANSTTLPEGEDMAPASLTEEADSGGSERQRADQVHNSAQDTLSTFFESKESVQGRVRHVSLHRSPAVGGSDDAQHRTGVGIVFGRAGLEATQRGHWKILQVLPNGTAFQSGLITPGVTLLAVDGRTVGDLVNPSGVCVCVCVERERERESQREREREREREKRERERERESYPCVHIQHMPTDTLSGHQMSPTSYWEPPAPR